MRGFRATVGASITKHHASRLAASYLLYLLVPYHRNYGKRLVKTPKLYILDAALAAWLTRQPSPAALAGGMGEALFEGW